MKLSFPTVLWARNGICSTYWLLASSFYQCNSRFGFTEVHKLLKHLKVVWPVQFSCKSTNLYIHRTGLLVRFDFYFSTPKCEGVKPPQVVQVTPEVTSWVHYMQEVTTRANDCLGKSIILEASHWEQRFPLVLKWLAQDIRYNRKGVEHELLIAPVELLFQERSLRHYESVPKWISRSSDSYIRTVPPGHTWVSIPILKTSEV